MFINVQQGSQICNYVHIRKLCSGVNKRGQMHMQGKLHSRLVLHIVALTRLFACFRFLITLQKFAFYIIELHIFLHYFQKIPICPYRLRMYRPKSWHFRRRFSHFSIWFTSEIRHASVAKNVELELVDENDNVSESQFFFLCCLAKGIRVRWFFNTSLWAIWALNSC